MAKFLEVYKCEQCGNILEVVHAGGGDPACCGQPAKLLSEGVTDAAKEKHVPVIAKTPGGYAVKVGAVAHPMEEKHFIQWVELVADGVSYTRFFKPGDAPEATFDIADAKNVFAREYCNLHGHWKAEA
ncbi:MAG: desulfoferrodoxin [Desulfovibrio sp.]|jgi:superoxide reductase|nr:desulfoferrodoxin [Desulfovibrio sp.]